MPKAELPPEFEELFGKLKEPKESPFVKAMRELNEKLKK